MSKSNNGLNIQSKFKYSKPCINIQNHVITNYVQLKQFSE